MKSLNDAFGLPMTVDSPQQELLPAIKEESLDNDTQDDIELARETMRDVITQGKDAFECALELAKGSEHPRAFEVVGQMMKTLSDVSKDLVDLQKQKKALKGTLANNQPAPVTNTQNNLFVGTPAEILRMIKDAKSSDPE